MTDWGTVLGWADPVGMATWFAGVGIFFWGLSRFLFGNRNKSHDNSAK